MKYMSDVYFIDYSTSFEIGKAVVANVDILSAKDLLEKKLLEAKKAIEGSSDNKIGDAVLSGFKTNQTGVLGMGRSKFVAGSPDFEQSYDNSVFTLSSFNDGFACAGYPLIVAAEDVEEAYNIVMTRFSSARLEKPQMGGLVTEFDKTDFRVSESGLLLANGKFFFAGK